MKYLFLLITFWGSTLNAQEITFETGTWTEVKAKAKSKRKLIFVDAFTTWCGPCKAMAKNTFADAEVVKLFNEKFINVKIDMEKGEGIELAKEYQVSCYPNLLFIDGEGKLVHQAAGFHKPEAFIELGKTALTPAKTFASRKAQFEKGKNTIEFNLDYLKTLSESCLSTDEALKTYFSAVKEDDLILPDNWKVIKRYLSSTESNVFDYLVKTRKAFGEKYTADSVNTKIYDVYLAEANTLTHKENANVEKIDLYKEKIVNTGFERADELNFMIDLESAEVSKDYEKYIRAASNLVDRYKGQDADFLNNVSWAIFENSSNNKQLAVIERWAKRSVEIKENQYNLDTYANILMKRANKVLAIEMEKKAIELAKKAGDDITDLDATLKKFEAN